MHPRAEQWPNVKTGGCPPRRGHDAPGPSDAGVARHASPWGTGGSFPAERFGARSPQHFKLTHSAGKWYGNHKKERFHMTGKPLFFIHSKHISAFSRTKMRFTRPKTRFLAGEPGVAAAYEMPCHHNAGATGVRFRNPPVRDWFPVPPGTCRGVPSDRARQCPVPHTRGSRCRRG